MIKAGQLVPKYLRNKHLMEPEKVGEPPCTHAQMVRYSDERGQWKVEFFQYQRADGTIGASGKPDPKRLRINSAIFVVDTQASS